MTNELVQMLAENRVDDFIKAADHLSGDLESRELVQRELLDKANAADDVVDLRHRRIAVDLICLLGLVKSVAVRCELLGLFQRQFNERRLVELAALEAQRAGRCNAPDPEIEFLQSLLRALLRVPDAATIDVADHVSRVFANTQFGRRLARRIRDICDRNDL